MDIQEVDSVKSTPLGKEPAPFEPAGAQKRAKAANRKRRAALSAFGFLLPNLVGFLAFTFFPVLFSFWMSFTNWSLEPAQKFQAVGLRNYIDLLGLRPLGASHPLLLWGYLACVLTAAAGLIGALWTNMAKWRGTRLGGAIMAAGGASLIAQGILCGWEGVAIAGFVALICGLLVALRDDTWLIGWGTLPAILLAVGAGGLLMLQPPLSRVYEPRDTFFWQFFYNTVYLMLGIPFSIMGSLVFALLVNEKLPSGPARRRSMAVGACLLVGAIMAAALWHVNADYSLLAGLIWVMAALGIAFNVVAFRTLFYLPTFTAGVALMILWKSLYNPKTGPIDLALTGIIHAFGLHATAPQWLSDVNWAKPALILMAIWTGIGGTNMLLYLAGLSNVPQELIDAAHVDGASAWGRFWNVTWPQLAPTTFFITITSLIGGFQAGFDQARVMTQGGPAGSTTTLAYYIYTKAFQELNLGYASAISWVLFAIVFIATALNWKFGKGLEVD